MKKSAIVILCLGVFLLSNAQTALKVREENRAMSKGAQNAFVVTVPQYKPDDLKKQWSKFMKDNSNGKTSETKGEVSMLGGTISKISLSPLSSYALFNETMNGSETAVFYEQDSAFISSASKPQLATLIHKLMFEFAQTAYVKVVEEELEAEQKNLKERQEEQEKLIKNENKSQANIVDCKNKIEKDENLLVVKKQDQEARQVDVTVQREKMMGVNQNAEEKKLQDKLVKNLENEKKKLIKEQGDLRKDILSQKKKISEEERNIVDLKAKQEQKKQEIAKQQEVVQKVSAKLEDIKKMQL